MKERPILFSGEMVRAILEGRKTQTRRIVKPEPLPYTEVWHPREQVCRHTDYWFARVAARCKYGVPGDRLWVRETWGDGEQNNCEPGVYYRATDPAWDEEETGFRWKPSIHMPRWASRITLEVTGVRVERLQDISEADARDEGAGLLLEDREYWDGDPDQYRKCFRVLWESINGPGSWAENPWVWVIEFKRIEVPA